MKQQSPDHAASNLLWFIYQWNRNHGGHPSIIYASDFRSEFRDTSDEMIKEQLHILINDVGLVKRCSGVDTGTISKVSDCLWGMYDLTESGLEEVLRLENYVKKSPSESLLQHHALHCEPENHVDKFPRKGPLAITKFLNFIMSWARTMFKWRKGE